MLIGLVATPVPLVMGIVYFVKRDYDASTLVFALGVFFACVLATVVFTGIKELALPEGLVSPFGYFAMFASYILGSKALSYFVGTIVNFTAIFAIIRFVQKRMASRIR
jgi:hypothetical protein